MTERPEETMRPVAEPIGVYHAARHYGVTQQTIRRWTNNGHLTAVRRPDGLLGYDPDTLPPRPTRLRPSRREPVEHPKALPRRDQVTRGELIRHARVELALAGYADEDPGYVEAILSAIGAVAADIDDPAALAATGDLLATLLRQRHLTPLTDDPADWADLGDGWYRCVRDPAAYSPDGGQTYFRDDGREPRRERPRKTRDRSR